MNPAYRFFGSGTRFGTWFAFAVPVVATVTVMLVGLIIGADVLGLSLIGITTFWAVFFFSLSLSLFFIKDSSRGLISLIGKLAPRSLPVRMMDFDGTSYYSLAWKKDGEWVAPVYWGTNVGKVVLNSNGCCDRRDCGYVYLWEPLRKSDRAHFFLMNIDQPSASEFAEWSRRERSEWVEKKRKEIS